MDCAKLMNYLSLTGKQFTCVPQCLTLWDSRCFYANEMIIKCIWPSSLSSQKLTYLSKKSSHVQKENLKSWSPIWLGYCVLKWLCLQWWIFFFLVNCLLENTWRKRYVFQCNFFFPKNKIKLSLLQYLTIVRKKQNIDFFAIDNQQIILKLIRKKGVC